MQAAPQMTLADAESILAQALDHPGLTLSFANHLIARDALRKLSEVARNKSTEEAQRHREESG